ncbi:SURF1 family protein [Massilia sp. IC2-477]|uniref:SURF1 family protein n=1 Tax=unclassified Massilia TaxID=2609279 RepID=UPI001D1230CD|nr:MULTISPECIES: SURF1 family cytochrome oxidase biogenesis protein [unclassified Massilia]MCC2955676.1 SURF1 family protein [Massilia sp. IC2-477]MCC2974929.1 SURF1 family protein [Massilia sp. IC2-476]
MQDRGQQAGPAAHPPRSLLARRVLAVVALLLVVLFLGLGTWQVVRLQWKLDLIARVDARVHANPVAPPPAARWAQVSRESDEYRRVRLAGHYLYEFTTPVQAVSELGAGFWLLTPLCTAEGHIVFINRGFIPATGNKPGRYPGKQAGADPCAGAGERVDVTGLLRISEPKGGFLRDNDPVTNRWFSRDVAALAAARRLTNVAPYFIDAGKNQDPADAPERAVGGLTVISFQNNHLVYALTWYALALMVGAAWWWVSRHGGKIRDDD